VDRDATQLGYWVGGRVKRPVGIRPHDQPGHRGCAGPGRFTLLPEHKGNKINIYCLSIPNLGDAGTQANPLANLQS
jgi:hypothetical protein